MSAESLLQLHKDGKAKKRSWRRNVWVFSLGGVFSMLVAGFLGTPTGTVDKLVTMAGLESMNLDSLIDVLPAGLIRDVSDLQVCPTSSPSSSLPS